MIVENFRRALGVAASLTLGLAVPAFAQTPGTASEKVFPKPVYSPGAATRNPNGSANSSYPSELGVAKRVTTGGSFLCTDQYCARYMPGGRGKEARATGTNHLGFRLVRDAG